MSKFENPELTKTRSIAKAAAAREGRAMVILDLNKTAGGLFVIRYDTPQHRAYAGFVEAVEP